MFDVEDIEGINASGPWDLAIIRLAEPREQPENPMLLTDPPSQPFDIHVLHHRAQNSGQPEPLLWSIGQLAQQLGSPVVRFPRDANTLGGSSGAPVFDSDWKIVALHQGGLRQLEHYRDVRQVKALDRNHAVPVRHWSVKLDELDVLSDDLPYLPYPPVIGQRDLQRRVWRAAMPHKAGDHRLLIIRGAPGSALGDTKTIVRELVKTTGRVRALGTTNALQDDPVTFAQRVLGTLSAQLNLPDTPGVTTLHSEVRQELAPVLAARLEGLAGGKPLWLVVEGLDRANGTEQSGAEQPAAGAGQ
ncbi:hypothetical protein [Lentzea flava]|uniref:Serine protease n=1 Tax=Lentzea flava TaxID=103732 RepID=A0ABQ2VI25_9PSEU|nr:hypothetical protein [Lentzea flava]MCP2205550.1 Trypsin-like peptidase domain [Lentzea flava]GGU87895.1 hypothetical protein GCM10010178_91950 [Lentzea flava]